MRYQAAVVHAPNTHEWTFRPFAHKPVLDHVQVVDEFEGPEGLGDDDPKLKALFESIYLPLRLLDATGIGPAGDFSEAVLKLHNLPAKGPVQQVLAKNGTVIYTRPA
jgi:hypothetical protein